MGLKLVFLIMSRVMSVLGLSRRESWWKDAEILMLRHQLAVARRQQPRVHARLTGSDRAWLALIAGTRPRSADRALLNASGGQRRRIAAWAGVGRAVVRPHSKDGLRSGSA